MTIDVCKNTLIDLLKNEELRVIALSGAWGTGKTHLWRTIQQESEDEKVISAVSASLFGLRDINALKMSAMQSAAFNNFKETTTGRSLRSLFSAGLKTLRGSHGAFGAIDDLALLLLPTALSKKLVVIDDIERKHQELTADEVLGFIDECCNRYDCRVLLILNEEKMADLTLWDTFREKVIDAEVRLETSTGEALAIALQKTPSPYAEEIKAAVEHCGVSNIRIIRRVIRACNLILKPYAPPHLSTLTRVIPSVAFLGFAHFRGIDDPPNLDFALTATNPTRRARLRLDGEQRPPTEEEKAENHWYNWLQKVGLRSTDELEAEIVKFYRSGLPDVSRIARILAANEANERRFSTQARAAAFLEHCFWCPSRTDESLVEEATQFVETAEFLDASLATSVCASAKELHGGAEVGERIIDRWIEGFQRRIAVSDQELDWHESQPRRSPLHPRIAQVLSERMGERANSVSLVDACINIHRKDAWGKTEKAQLSGATVSSYLDAVRSVEGRDLISFMAVMLDISKEDLDGHAHFGPAGRNFVEACKREIADAPEGRLTRVIRHSFESDQLEHLL